jgi:hypothetical protein
MLRKKLLEAIAEPLEEVRRIYRRYRHPFCLLLIETSEPLEIGRQDLKIRETDEVSRVDDNHTAIILRFVGEKSGGYKAAENILYRLENRFPRPKISIGIACKDRPSQEDIVTRVLYALAKAKDHPENFLEDDADLDGSVT